jgi:hypothetical protein
VQLSSQGSPSCQILVESRGKWQQLVWIRHAFKCLISQAIPMTLIPMIFLELLITVTISQMSQRMNASIE